MYRWGKSILINFVVSIYGCVADLIQCLNDVDTLGVTVSIMRKHVTYPCKYPHII